MCLECLELGPVSITWVKTCILSQLNCEVVTCVCFSIELGIERISCGQL